MRELVKSHSFWMVVVAVVVPFGWLYPLLRTAVRSLSR
jgi:hypothetical protein